MHLPPSLRLRLLPLALLPVLATKAHAQEHAWTGALGSPLVDTTSFAAPDGSRGVFLGGTTGGVMADASAGEEDMWVARYDRSGTRLWVHQYGTSLFDHLLTGTEDGSGGVFVAGNLWNYGGSIADVWLGRLDAGGVLLWRRDFGTSSTETAVATAPDGSGGVYVAGMTEGDLGGANAGLQDLWLARYDGAGNRAWILQQGTAAIDFARALTTDPSGGVFACGVTAGDLGGPPAGGIDAWIARFDADGSMLWIRQLGTPGNDRAEALAPDGQGGAFVGGETDRALAGGGQDIWIARYDATGERLWTRRPSTSEWDSLRSLSPDARGGVYVGAGLGIVFQPGGEDVRTLRLDAAGTVLWDLESGTDRDEHVGGSAPDGAGGLYLCGTTLNGPDVGREDAWVSLFLAGPARHLDFQTEDDGSTELVNGQHIDTEFGALVELSSTGPNAGLAVFDSTPGGPNDPGPDPDLLIDRGNLLILQTENMPPDANDVFPLPNDDEDGGTIEFDFLQPVEARGMRLVDIDAGDGPAEVLLTDVHGLRRTYTVPASWTGDPTVTPPGHRRLDLSTLAPQPGLGSVATVQEDGGFDPIHVARIEVTLRGSGAVDDLKVFPACLASAALSARTGGNADGPVLSASGCPLVGQAWNATVDCAGFSPGIVVLSGHRRPASGTWTPFGEVLVAGALVHRQSQVLAGTPSVFTWDVPYALALVGADAHFQALCRAWSTPPMQGKVRRLRAGLSNALDVIIGF